MGFLKNTDLVRQKIAKGDITGAKKDLFDLVEEEKGLRNALILIESRYANLQQKEQLGTKTPEELEVYKTRLATALLQLIDNFEDSIKSANSNSKKVQEDLQLKAVTVESVNIQFMQKRTGELFSLTVSIDISVLELKNRLVKSVKPGYFANSILQEEIDFELRKLEDDSVLEDTKSLRDNGIQEGNTVYLKKRLIYEDEK